MTIHTIGEICNINALSIRKGEHPKQILYLDTANLVEGRICKLQEINFADAPSRAQRKINNDTILYSSVRPNLKHFGIMKSMPSNVIVSTGFITLDVKDKSLFSPEYIYYLLTQQGVVDYLQGIAQNGVSAYPSINPSDIANLKFNFPSLSDQEHIASVLTNIDRKIALNRQINDNLEAMAKQLYDYWFVQFDFPNEEGKPYKSSGGALVWNEKLKREIPSCFEVVNMGNLCDFRNGINYSKDETGNDYQIVNVRNISSSRILLDGEDFDVITVPTSKAENYVLKPDDIIIARSGCPGSTRLLLSSANTLFCGFIICCSPKDSSMRNYLVYCLKQLEGTNATTSGGSILQNVSQDTLKGLHVIVPEKQIIDKFNKTIELIFARMLNCLKESKALTKQRDELLPLLMNGQASVNLD